MDALTVFVLAAFFASVFLAAFHAGRTWERSAPTPAPTPTRRLPVTSSQIVDLRAYVQVPTRIGRVRS